MKIKRLPELRFNVPYSQHGTSKLYIVVSHTNSACMTETCKYSKGKENGKSERKYCELSLKQRTLKQVFKISVNCIVYDKSKSFKE